MTAMTLSPYVTRTRPLTPIRWATGALRALPALLALLALTVTAPAATAQEAGGRVTPTAGVVQFRLDGAADFAPLAEARPLPASAFVRTGATGTATIAYGDGTEVLVRPGSTVRVGGESEEGVAVFIGRILVRARRLLSPSERRYRTPVAVAAIRGTEFGVIVGPRAVTDIYVVEGAVWVANVEALADSVLVPAGSATRVEPLRAPTPPRPFAAGEYDRLGVLDALERGEDPVLEASQEPAEASYLALAVPFLDVPVNPAYLTDLRAPFASSVLAVGAYRDHASVEVDGAETSAATTGAAATYRGLGAAAVGDRWTAGVYAAGLLGDQELPSANTGPGGTPDPTATTTATSAGEATAIAAGTFGSTALGFSAGLRGSRVTVDTEPAGAARTRTDNRVASLGAGLLTPRHGGRLAVSLRHQFLSGDVAAGSLAKDITGHDDLLQLRFRRGGSVLDWGALTELEWTRTDEDVEDAGSPVYRETRKVLAARIGGGVGYTPTAGLLLAADLVGGVSYEDAVQRLPTGGVREDESDVRLSATAHTGVHVRVSRAVIASLDVSHHWERLGKDFELLVGTPAESVRTERSLASRTRASTGIGYLSRRFLVQYVLSGDSAAGPVVHSVVLVWTPR